MSKRLTVRSKALGICQKTDDKRGVGLSYLRLGYACAAQSQFQPAVEHYQKVVEIAQAQAYRDIEAEALANMGSACRAMGDYEQAISYHQQSLEISHVLLDKRGEGYSLKDIGNVLFLTGRYDEAIARFQQAIATCSSDRRSQVRDRGFERARFCLYDSKGLHAGAGLL